MEEHGPARASRSRRLALVEPALDEVTALPALQELQSEKERPLDPADLGERGGESVLLRVSGEPLQDMGA